MKIHLHKGMLVVLFVTCSFMSVVVCVIDIRFLASVFHSKMQIEKIEDMDGVDFVGQTCMKRTATDFESVAETIVRQERKRLIEYPLRRRSFYGYIRLLGPPDGFCLQPYSVVWVVSGSKTLELQSLGPLTRGLVDCAVFSTSVQ